jgi:hypothetical protein
MMTTLSGFAVPGIVAASAIYTAYRFGKHEARTLHEQPSPRVAASAITNLVVVGKAPLVKFYSRRNKEELADVLTDLSVLLDTTGDQIVKKHQETLGRWNMESTLTRQGRQPDTTALLGKLNELQNLTVVLHRALCDDGGFLAKNQVYSEELNSVLQLSQNALNDNPIDIFRRSVNAFREGMEAIELAQRHNDQRLILVMVWNMTPARDTFLKVDGGFRAWQHETKKRIATFRTSIAAASS